MEILTNLFYQLVFTVGLIALFGMLISLLRKIFIGFSGSVGYYILLILGIVGTPVHELSHALMCLLFGHKVKEIKLFRPGASDGTLGYVNHTYNPRNIYHQIGNFFIGTAPIILGSALILGLMYFMIPEAFATVTTELTGIGSLPTNFLSPETYTAYFSLFSSVFTAIFNPEHFEKWTFWLFLLLAVMISSHMELSFADIKGGAKGFFFIALILLFVDSALFFISPELLTSMTAVMTSFAVSVVGFLGISVFFLALMVGVAFIFKIIF